MNNKVRFITLLLLFVLGLIACTSKKEEKISKVVSQTNSNELHDEHNSIDILSPHPPIYDNVQQMPQFPGGEEKLRAFISKNIKCPAIVKENGIQGKVIVRFVVTKVG